MSVIQTYNFNNALNFNLTNTTIDVNKLVLSKINNTGLTFNQAFTADTGFTYDNTKAEFTAGVVRQKDLRPTDGVLAATYTTSKDLSWSTSGSLVATDIGTPTLSGGKVTCLGGGNNSVRYESADIGTSGNVGAIRIRYTPNYSGTPAANYNIFEFAPVSGNNDRMLVIHSASGGTLRLTAYTSVGTVKHSAVILGAAWSPVAGTEYELELNWDTIAGSIRLFVNGVLQGGAPVSSYSRGSDADRLYIGAGTVYTATDASFNDVLLFSTVQHTSGYTPGYTIPETIYAETPVTLPTFTYSLLGDVQEFTNFVTTETSTVRYIMNGLYWSGSAWVASDNSYNQSNPKTTTLANIASLPASDSLIVKVVFTGQNTQASVDDLTVTYTGQHYSTDGTATPVQPINTSELIIYTNTLVETANAKTRLHMLVDGVATYWNGSSWAASNSSFSQSNTASDFNTNLSSFNPGSNSTIYLVWVFNTTNQQETSELSTSSIEYDFGGVESELATCLIWGYYKDLSGLPVEGAVVTFSIKREKNQYKEANNNIVEKPVVTTTDVNGYFEAYLIRSSEFEGTGIYKFKIQKTTASLNTSSMISGNSIELTVPDSDEKNITDLLGGN